MIYSIKKSVPISCALVRKIVINILSLGILGWCTYSSKIFGHTYKCAGYLEGYKNNVYMYVGYLLDHLVIHCYWCRFLFVQ